MLKVLQAGAAAEQIQRDVENVVRFVIRRVAFEDRCGKIDVLSQFEFS